MKILSKLLLLFMIPLMWSSCKTEQPKSVLETVKNINGSWQVVGVTQNGVDITSSNGIDLSQFRITFQNNAYTLSNQIPFIVYQNGTFSLDDPKVPTGITFIATGGQPVTSTFNYPITSLGVRNMVITFYANPGCTDNQYVYTLQKVN